MYGLKNQLCNKDVVHQQKTWGNHFWRAVLPVKTQERVTMQAQVSFPYPVHVRGKDKFDFLNESSFWVNVAPYYLGLYFSFPV